MDFDQIFGVAAGSFIKPVIAIPAARIAGLSFMEAFLGGMAGGCAGFIVFMNFLDVIIHWIGKIFRRKRKIKDEKKKKPVFTKRSRFIVKTINVYGLPGLAVISPLLSIPLAAFIAERLNDRFVHNKKKVISAICISMAVWSAILSGLSGFF